MELKFVNNSHFKQLFQNLRPKLHYSKNIIFVISHFGTLLSTGTSPNFGGCQRLRCEIFLSVTFLVAVVHQWSLSSKLPCRSTFCHHLALRNGKIFEVGGLAHPLYPPYVSSVIEHRFSSNFWSLLCPQFTLTQSPNFDDLFVCTLTARRFPTFTGSRQPSVIACLYKTLCLQNAQVKCLHIF